MFSLSIALDGPIVWSLMYKTKEAAANAWIYLSAPGAASTVELKDDFGHCAIVMFSRFAGAIMEDMSLTKIAHIERGLHEARTRAKMQQDAQADPVLRTAAMTQGPAMISPMGNGPFPRN
jgi:hypothetical protein